MNNLIEAALNAGERRGYTISKHPNGTAVIRNFREYVLFFPQPDGSVKYEVREPLYQPSKVGNTGSEIDVLRLVRELK